MLMLVMDYIIVGVGDSGGWAFQYFIFNIFMMLVVDGQLQVDLFWLAVQQLLGKDPKEAPLCQPPENFSWGECRTKYF